MVCEQRDENDREAMFLHAVFGRGQLDQKVGARIVGEQQSSAGRGGKGQSGTYVPATARWIEEDGKKRAKKLCARSLPFPSSGTDRAAEPGPRDRERDLEPFGQRVGIERSRKRLVQAVDHAALGPEPRRFRPATPSSPK